MRCPHGLDDRTTCGICRAKDHTARLHDRAQARGVGVVVRFRGSDVWWAAQELTDHDVAIRMFGGRVERVPRDQVVAVRPAHREVSA